MFPSPAREEARALTALRGPDDVPQMLPSLSARSSGEGEEKSRGRGTETRVWADPTPPALQAQASDPRRRLQDSELKSGIVREATGSESTAGGGQGRQGGHLV